MNIKTDLQTWNGFFNTDMQFKHLLLHIYVKIIKFDPFNAKLFWWLSGVVQGMVFMRHKTESHSEPFFLFFPDWHYYSDVPFFLVFVKSPYVEFKKILGHISIKT